MFVVLREDRFFDSGWHIEKPFRTEEEAEEYIKNQHKDMGKKKLKKFVAQNRFKIEKHDF